jgi:putative aldouronate transport system substrate-binding protein
MKKILSLVLALAMLLGVCSFAAAESEPVKLIWWMGCTTEAPIDWAEVEAALNAYSAEKIGVVCEFKYLTESQVGTAMNTGEPFDICFTCDWYNDYATNVANGMFLDLSEKLDDYPALKDSVIPSAWEALNSDGHIYAIPHMKDIGMEIFWIIDTNYFVTEKGLEPNHYIGFEEMEKYFEMYKADHPDDYPFKMSRGGLTSWENCLVDWLNEDYLVGLDWDAQGTDQEYVVKSALEIPAWVNRLRTIHSWYEKGYINKDAAVTESMPRAQAGVVQSGQGWFGAETVWANAIKKPVYISRFDGPFMSTYSVRGSMTAVSAATEHPDECLKLIELMNTDTWYRETARYGIEGKHYTRNEDGTVTKTELGADNMSLWAYTQGHYTVGAVEASPFPEVPADPDQWAKVFEGYADAKVSAVMGFTADLSDIMNECLAISQIYQEYKYELITGTSDPDVVIPEMLERMNEAGLPTIISTLQAQVDAFVASK